VAELEGGWNINRHWAAWLMGGGRLWGEGVPSTYDRRVGIGVACLFCRGFPARKRVFKF